MKSYPASLLASVLLSAACGGGASTAPPEIDKRPAQVVTSIVVYSGNDQSAARGSALQEPLCTNVLDQAGHRMIGVPVTYTVASGGGTVGAPSTASTDGAGIATSGTWTLGPSGGAQTVTASAGTNVTVTFRAIAN
jgi:hypothetical protein